MNTTLEKTESHAMSVSEAMQLSSAQVTEQVQLIQQVLRSVMKQDEHYGIIPGTTKPTLLKAGAEKLCLTFRLSPAYRVERIDHPNGHREYIITAVLTHIPTGKIWGEGVGSCSTLEKKYRYRSDYVNTGRQVPKAYWDDRDNSLIGGKGYVPKKDENGIWMIHESSGQQENPDIAEQYNTVLKMAKKRALTDATINACAASDIFTQDIEDFQPPEPPPQPEKQPLKGKPENVAAQAQWERDKLQAAEREKIAKNKKRWDALPKDIREGFAWTKDSVDQIISVLDTNNNDPVQIRAYLEDKGWRGSADLSDVAAQAMPEAG